MPDLNEGDKAPDFSLPSNSGGTVSLKDFKGKNLILYFYPKDDTPGCTAQACAFRDDLPNLTGLNAAVLGVSKDSAKSHDKFREKYNLNFPLASDEEGTMCTAYGVWKNKSMYGKSFLGIERTTFLIDGKGVIRQIWRKVKVEGHADEVRKALDQAKAA